MNNNNKKIDFIAEVIGCRQMTQRYWVRVRTDAFLFFYFFIYFVTLGSEIATVEIDLIYSRIELFIFLTNGIRTQYLRQPSVQTNHPSTTFLVYRSTWMLPNLRSASYPGFLLLSIIIVLALNECTPYLTLENHAFVLKIHIFSESGLMGKTEISLVLILIWAKCLFICLWLFQKSWKEV